MLKESTVFNIKRTEKTKGFRFYSFLNLYITSLLLLLEWFFILFIALYDHSHFTLQAKQRKMKEKYKDQDDEERQLRMEILAVSRWS